MWVLQSRRGGRPARRAARHGLTYGAGLRRRKGSGPHEGERSTPVQAPKPFLPLAILCLGITACGPERGGAEPAVDEGGDVGEATSAILGGYLDDEDTHAVAIARLSSMAFGSCSGTLISANVVLTAQHCVAQTSGDGFVQCGSTTFSPTYDPTEFYVTTRSSLSQNIADYHRVREVQVASGPDFCGNDVAILILGDVVLPDEAKWAVPRVDVQLTQYEEYYAIGHGNTSDGGGGNPTRRRRDGLFTQCVGSACGLQSGVAATEWRGEAGICSGDSGGGSYDLFNRVHGIASRGSQGCEAPVYGGVFGWADWLKDITVYAAGLGAIDPPPWALGFPTDPQFDHPVGEACNDVDECSSGACLDGYCTRPCNEAAFCPEDYTCNPDQWCEAVPETDEESTAAPRQLVVSNGCSISSSRTDPTEPIPWEALPLALGAMLLVARREHLG